MFPPDEGVRNWMRERAEELARMIAGRQCLPHTETVCVNGCQASLSVVSRAFVRSLDLPQDMTQRLESITPCEKDIVAVLLKGGRPLPGAAIGDLLESSGQLYGSSTVKHALARLVQLGILANSRRPPKGYDLTPEVRIKVHAP
jgi:hypothetical protein